MLCIVPSWHWMILFCSLYSILPVPGNFLLYSSFGYFILKMNYGSLTRGLASNLQLKLWAHFLDGPCLGRPRLEELTVSALKFYCFRFLFWMLTSCCQLKVKGISWVIFLGMVYLSLHNPFSQLSVEDAARPQVEDHRRPLIEIYCTSQLLIS